METENKVVNEEKVVVKKTAVKPIEKFKTEKCEVLNYDEKFKTLDVLFKGSGIRFNDVSTNVGEFVEVKYRGEIGKPNFVYKL